MPSKGKQKHRHGRGKRRTPLEGFFAAYPEFDYDSTQSASHEFYRLCDELGWSRYDAKREKAHKKFKDALVRQFNNIYGTDEDDLDGWQNLCHVVDIGHVPDDLEGFREAIRGTHVNLVDLVDRNVTGQDIKIFDSERELSEYTRSQGKYFPKENAYAGGFLRYLLRHILHPSDEGPSRLGTRGRR